MYKVYNTCKKVLFLPSTISKAAKAAKAPYPGFLPAAIPTT